MDSRQAMADGINATPKVNHNSLLSLSTAILIAVEMNVAAANAISIVVLFS